jgi:hypothetical protein
MGAMVGLKENREEITCVRGREDEDEMVVVAGAEGLDDVSAVVRARLEAGLLDEGAPAGTVDVGLVVVDFFSIRFCCCLALTLK